MKIDQKVCGSVRRGFLTADAQTGAAKILPHPLSLRLINIIKSCFGFADFIQTVSNSMYFFAIWSFL